MKDIKVFNNECFRTYRTTAVLVSKKWEYGASYDNTLTIYSHKNTLLELLTNNRYLAEIMNEYGYEITKDWNMGDIIIIKIYIHTFDEPFKAESEEF